MLPHEVLRPGCGDEQGRVLIPILLRNSAHMKGGVDIFDYENALAGMVGQGRRHP